MSIKYITLECFDMRMERTALYAIEKGFRYFTTTNATSRWKDVKQVNESGIRGTGSAPLSRGISCILCILYFICFMYFMYFMYFADFLFHLFYFFWCVVIMFLSLCFLFFNNFYLFFLFLISLVYLLVRVCVCVFLLF